MGVRKIEWTNSIGPYAKEGKIDETGKDMHKILVLGASNVGKSTMCAAYRNREFPAVYVPTINDVQYGKVADENKSISIAVYDTAGRGDYFELRRLLFPNTRSIVLCFSVDSKNSVDVIPTEYVSEINTYMPGVPVLLVACKIDLRDDLAYVKERTEYGKPFVPKETGPALVKHHKFAGYMECSALKETTAIDEIFEKALQLAEKFDPDAKRPEKKEKCVLM